MGKYMQADEKLIKALLYESDISRYKISKDTGIPDNTLSDLANGKTSFENMRFGTATRLTEYAKTVDLRNEKLTSDQKKELAEMNNIFTTYDDMDQFKKAYVSLLANPPEDYHKYGWDYVAKELIQVLIGCNTGHEAMLKLDSRLTVTRKTEQLYSGTLTENNKLTYK